MRFNPIAIRALVKKDLVSLFPLILLSFAAFFIVPLVATLDIAALGGDQEFWLSLQSNIYWLGYFMGVLLMVSVLQQDPAESLSHDWLTRPIARSDWLVAKLLFLILAVLVPVLLARIVANLSTGMDLGLSIYFAMGIDSFEATILVPLFLMVALLAPTLRKLILLLVLVFFFFLLPGWSVTSPMLSALGIEIGGDFNALMWIQGLMIVIAGLCGATGIFWYLYCRRQSRAAYSVFTIAVVVTFLTVYPPQYIYDWDEVIAINTALINSDIPDLDNQVVLEQATACFPAVFVDDENGVAQDLDLLAQPRWASVFLEAAGPGAMSIATPIRDRELLASWITPAKSQRDYAIDWRLDRIRSRAWLSADSLAEDVELRYSSTAENRSAPISATETSYWLVPGSALAESAYDPSAQLILEYDLALLAPVSYELPVDGQRQKFPELGYCKAELDSTTNEIAIECLKRGEQPDLVSAHYIGMDSSRVDNSNRANLTNNAIESLKRYRYELILESASLADNTSVIVSAYNAERLMKKQLVIPGILGDDRVHCPLPGESLSEIERPASWSDKSRHEISFVTTERGVRLELLDWREEIKPDAPTLFLLPGLGATAHSFDEVAEELSLQYNVLAMTRRGTGDSSTPDRGYDIASLGRDILQVLDALDLDSVILIGHSFGGEELSYLGANYPERVDGLIYLDAAYDRVTVNSGESLRRYRELNVRLPQAPPVRPAEAVSYEALDLYRQRTGRTGTGNIPEGEIIASYDLTTGGTKHQELYLDALMRGITAPDYANISVPALAIYAVPGSPGALMEAWYDQSDPQVQMAVQELYEMERRRKTLQIERFDSEVPDSKALILEDADHWVFLSHEQEVLDAIDDFISSLH